MDYVAIGQNVLKIHYEVVKSVCYLMVTHAIFNYYAFLKTELKRL